MCDCICEQYLSAKMYTYVLGVDIKFVLEIAHMQKIYQNLRPVSFQQPKLLTCMYYLQIRDRTQSHFTKQFFCIRSLDNVWKSPVSLFFPTCILLLQIRNRSLLVIWTMLGRDRSLFLCLHSSTFLQIRDRSLLSIVQL